VTRATLILGLPPLLFESREPTPDRRVAPTPRPAAGKEPRRPPGVPLPTRTGKDFAMKGILAWMIGIPIPIIIILYLVDVF
jgi:hypothetical protein